MGEGPIPFASIDRFARRYGLDDLASFDDFSTQIRALDGTYLKIRSEQAERDREAGKGTKPV